MAKKMKQIAAAALAATIVFGFLYKIRAYGMLLSLAVTCGTIAYHLIMRLTVGFIFDTFMKNRANTRAGWYRVGEREAALYRRLGVQRWKRRMPSYDGALFDMKKHSPDEIAQAMCQAELVHETIIPLSILPIAAGHFFGAYPVFIITSIFAAVADAAFVMLQRYNRPRVISLMNRQAERDARSKG